MLLRKLLKPVISFFVLSLLFLDASAEFRLTPNKGQWRSDILFQSDLNGCKLFVRNSELTYLFYNSNQVKEAQHSNDFSETVDAHALNIRFLGANPNASYFGQNECPSYTNYFIGNNPAEWAAKVKSYNKLYVTEIYPHIDFELLEQNGNLKYNFIVNPGGNPSDISIEYNGADSLFLLNGVLKIKTRFGFISELRPFVFQENQGNKTVIASKYNLEGNKLSFNLSGKRNAGQPIVIDPVLVFSSYTGSSADNFGYTATYDTLGNGYAGGTVFSAGYPTTNGAFQMQFAGGATENMSIGYISRDCGIMKFSPDGKSLVYATYLGGRLHNDQPHSMIVDSKLNLIIMGTTKSRDFPLGNSPHYNSTLMGLSDIFIVKFSPDGSTINAGTLIGGTGFDGLNGDRASSDVTPLLYNYADDFRGEVIVDGSDNVYVASVTTSVDFPLKNSFDAGNPGTQDGVVFKFNSRLDNLMFSSYIGGSGDDAAYGIDLGTHSDVYVTGGTTSQSFNYAVPGFDKDNNGGRADGFLIRFDAISGQIKSSTFIGTTEYDQSYFVKTDKYGKPFVYGQSEGVNAVSPGVEGTANTRQFIKKLDVNCTAIELQTSFGAANKLRPDISPTALLVDECERIFIAGWGGVNFAGFPGGGTDRMKTTPDAYQKTTDGYDFYLAVFSKNFQELQYATYFGGRSSFSVEAHEHVDGGTSRFDKKGVVYQSVCAGCGVNNLFPTTAGAWSRTNNSNNCNNALFKFDFENLNRKPLARDSMFVVIATDTLNFNIEVSDQDISDSLLLVLDGPVFHDSKFPKPLPFIKDIKKVAGKNNISANIVFYPNCNHVGLDTIRLYVKVYDRGCPSQDSNQAVIKILVKDPPLSVTPETYCLNFNPDGSVNIKWEAFAKNKFFKYILLKRINPNGKISVLDTLRTTNAGVFRDRPPSDPKTFNYTYMMHGYNICNIEFDNGAKVSTTKEFNVPIDSTYLNFATVKENKAVEVSWFKSKEDDFDSYDIYRADNLAGQSEGYRRIQTIYNLNDTVFVDNKVNVAAKSYCYRIVVNDKCGHYSKPTNDACNIVLTGDVGHLYFDLDWTTYRYWHGGVDHYELSRRVDTGVLRKLVNTNLMRVHHDEDLDLWWGAYYYVATAFEGTNVNGEGYQAKSVSNEIRLIQPPMVFVPNAFSINGDGINDVWGVSHAFVKEYNLKVFNRWGEKVWENDFKGNQWDGVTRGESASNDVFIWIITYKGWDGKFYTQKGTVTVMH